MKAWWAGLRRRPRSLRLADSARQLAWRRLQLALVAALACAVLALALGERSGDGEESVASVARPAWERSLEQHKRQNGEAAASRVLLPPPEASAPAPAADDAGVEEAALAQAAPAPAQGYRLQLGVFGAPANALALQQRLQREGLPAGLQSRVVLGPFADEAAARKAQARLRAAGMEEGMLLPPAQPAVNNNTARP